MNDSVGFCSRTRGMRLEPESHSHFETFTSRGHRWHISFRNTAALLPALNKHTSHSLFHILFFQFHLHELKVVAMLRRRLMSPIWIQVLCRRLSAFPALTGPAEATDTVHVRHFTAQLPFKYPQTLAKLIYINKMIKSSVSSELIWRESTALLLIHKSVEGSDFYV